MLSIYKYEFRRYLVVAGVGETMLREELLLNQPRAGKSTQRIRATSFVIGTTGTGTTEGLLTNKRSSCLAV